MLSVRLDAKPAHELQILLLGAHSDDIEIGCGGTVLKLVERYPEAQFHWVVFSALEEARKREALESAGYFLEGASGAPSVVVKPFRTSFFPYQGLEIKEAFEELKAQLSPDVVFTHCRHDLHQDHRVICELTWNTFRDHLIFEYEIPKYDGDLGVPNVYVPLDEQTVERKVELLMRVFGSQRPKHWFAPETFKGLMRVRGVECAAEHAEAFFGRKLVVGLSTPV
jgi:LmbE family N-acetylglucosaminyl deacetylase